MWKSVKRWIGIDPGPGHHAAGTTENPERLFDPDNPDFVQNPYPYFRLLREHHPFYMNHLGIRVLSRYRDVVNALADKRLGNEPSRFAVVSARNRDKYVCADVANNTLPFLEGEHHQRLRKIIAPAFYSWIRNESPDMEAVAAELLQPLKSNDDIDLLNDFATPLSSAVLCRILGFSERDGPQLKIWSDYFFYLFSVIPSVQVREELDRALGEFRDYVGEFVNRRKHRRERDFISRLLDMREDGADFSDRELIDNCMLLFADGIGNVDSGFANVMACLLAHPDQLAMLYRDDSLVPKAVDEGLRYESPAQFIARVASEDLELHGETLKKNQAVFLVLASANRDPEHFPDADRFDITRTDNNDYLSFGRGTHSCVGAQLVRMQMQAALRIVLRELPGMAAKSGTLSWRTRFGHRWLQDLCITFNRGDNPASPAPGRTHD